MERELTLKLYTEDRFLASRLVERPKAKRGDEVEIADQIHLRFRGRRSSTREVGGPEILLFVLSFPSGVAASYVSSVVYDFLKGRDKEQSIEDAEVTPKLREELDEIEVQIDQLVEMKEDLAAAKEIEKNILDIVSPGQE